MTAEKSSKPGIVDGLSIYSSCGRKWITNHDVLSFHLPEKARLLKKFTRNWWPYAVRIHLPFGHLRNGLVKVDREWKAFMTSFAEEGQTPPQTCKPLTEFWTESSLTDVWPSIILLTPLASLFRAVHRILACELQMSKVAAQLGWNQNLWMRGRYAHCSLCLETTFWPESTRLTDRFISSV